MPAALICGSGDIGSAIAHTLFRQGYSIIVADTVAPAHLRRGMAFVDAFYEGSAKLEGIVASYAESTANLLPMLRKNDGVVCTSAPISSVIEISPADVLIDARMRKRAVPPSHRGLAPLTIGVGPGWRPHDNTDIAIESKWGSDLGRVLVDGTTYTQEGEPQPIDGYSRERFVYASRSGIFHTTRCIAEFVRAHEVVGHLDQNEIRAPLSGRLKGLVHDRAHVASGTKLVEIYPRADGEGIFGIGRRPLVIANSVLSALARGLGGARAYLGKADVMTDAENHSGRK